MQTPVIGEVWKSDTLQRSFRVLSGPEALPGWKEWAAEQFVGHRAQQLGGQKADSLALVGLTKKPKGYPYDWVLINS